MTAPPHPTARTRVAAALGVSADVSPAGARAAFLRRLAAEDFAPPEDCVAAVNVLAGTALTLTPDANGVRSEVEAFAEVFWSLPPAERRTRWSDLSGRCRSGALAAARLADLEPGLDVATTPHADPLVEEVAAVVCEVFVLGRRGRAVRRAAWLAEGAGQFRDLADAPALARLDPELFRRLTEGTPPAAVPPLATPPEKPFEDDREGTDYWQARDVKNAKRIVRLGCLLGVLTFLAVPALSTLDCGREHPTGSPRGASPTAPDMTFSAREVGRVSDYDERRLSARRPGVVPPRLVPPSWYEEWVRLGRPAPSDATAGTPTRAP